MREKRRSVIRILFVVKNNQGTNSALLGTRHIGICMLSTMCPFLNNPISLAFLVNAVPHANKPKKLEWETMSVNKIFMSKSEKKVVKANPLKHHGRGTRKSHLVGFGRIGNASHLTIHPIKFPPWICVSYGGRPLSCPLVPHLHTLCVPCSKMSNHEDRSVREMAWKLWQVPNFHLASLGATKNHPRIH